LQFSSDSYKLELLLQESEVIFVAEQENFTQLHQQNLVNRDYGLRAKEP